jgi:hypothetical protein
MDLVDSATNDREVAIGRNFGIPCQEDVFQFHAAPRALHDWQETRRNYGTILALRSSGRSVPAAACTRLGEKVSARRKGVRTLFDSHSDSAESNRVLTPFLIRVDLTPKIPKSLTTIYRTFDRSEVVSALKAVCYNAKLAAVREQGRNGLPSVCKNLLFDGASDAMHGNCRNQALADAAETGRITRADRGFGREIASAGEINAQLQRERAVYVGDTRQYRQFNRRACEAGTQAPRPPRSQAPLGNASREAPLRVGSPGGRLPPGLEAELLVAGSQAELGNQGDQGVSARPVVALQPGNPPRRYSSPEGPYMPGTGMSFRRR